jgi:hypothetical protein
MQRAGAPEMTSVLRSALLPMAIDRQDHALARVKATTVDHPTTDHRAKPMGTDHQEQAKAELLTAPQEQDLLNEEKAAAVHQTTGHRVKLMAIDRQEPVREELSIVPQEQGLLNAEKASVDHPTTGHRVKLMAIDRQERVVTNAVRRNLVANTVEAKKKRATTALFALTDFSQMQALPAVAKPTRS